MIDALVGISILLPVIAALMCFMTKNHGLRAAVVVITGIGLTIASFMVLQNGPFSYTPESILGLNINSLITLADFALLFIILGIAFKLGNPLVILLTLLQIVPLAYFVRFSPLVFRSTTGWNNKRSSRMVQVDSVITPQKYVFSLSLPCIENLN